MSTVAPVLLDTCDLLKAGMSLILLLLMVFVGGFIAGYHKIGYQQATDTVHHVLYLPENIALAENALVHSLPEKLGPGATIDVALSAHHPGCRN